MVSNTAHPPSDDDEEKENSRGFWRRTYHAFLREIHEDGGAIFIGTIILLAIYASFLTGSHYLDNKFKLEDKRLDIEVTRVAIEQQRLNNEILHQKEPTEKATEKAIEKAAEPQAGLVTVRDVLIQAKSDPSKFQSVVQAASVLIDTLVRGAKITAAEGNDIKKVLIDKGIGGGIDEAIKIVDKLINKYLGLSDEDEKSKSSASGVVVNVYCSGVQKPRTVITDPPKPKKSACEGATVQH